MAAKKSTNESYYVGVDQPTVLRRSLLESSKQILESMRRYQELSNIRAIKNAELKDLSRIVESVKKDIADLKKILPTVKVTRPATKKKTASKKTAKPTETKHISSIESELEQIEQKLKALE